MWTRKDSRSSRKYQSTLKRQDAAGLTQQRSQVSVAQRGLSETGHEWKTTDGPEKEIYQHRGTGLCWMCSYADAKRKGKRSHICSVSGQRRRHWGTGRQQCTERDGDNNLSLWRQRLWHFLWTQRETHQEETRTLKRQNDKDFKKTKIQGLREDKKTRTQRTQKDEDSEKIKKKEIDKLSGKDWRHRGHRGQTSVHL